MSSGATLSSPAYCIFASGGLHRFYVGGSPFPQHLKFQLSNTQAYFNVDVVCHTELQTDIINTKTAGNVDLVFKRGDVEYMKFEGTLQAVELKKVLNQTLMIVSVMLMSVLEGTP